MKNVDVLQLSIALSIGDPWEGDPWSYRQTDWYLLRKPEIIPSNLSIQLMCCAVLKDISPSLVSLLLLPKCPCQHKLQQATCPDYPGDQGEVIDYPERAHHSTLATNIPVPPRWLVRGEKVLLPEGSALETEKRKEKKKERKAEEIMLLDTAKFFMQLSSRRSLRCPQILILVMKCPD